MDPLRHPDLVELTHRLRSQYELVRGAEQEAAAISHRRSLTLRDRFLEAEDRHERAIVTTIDGRRIEGPVAGVGLDHVLVAGSVVPLSHITRAELQ